MEPSLNALPGQTAALSSSTAVPEYSAARPLRRILIVDDALAVRNALREALVELPDTGEIVEADVGVGERLRQSVEDAKVTAVGSDGVSNAVTVSIGVAVWPGCPAERLDVLAAAAGKALYPAKSSGRNRCVCSGAPLQTLTAPAPGVTQ